MESPRIYSHFLGMVQTRGGYFKTFKLLQIKVLYKQENAIYKDQPNENQMATFKKTIIC